MSWKDALLDLFGFEPPPAPKPKTPPAAPAPRPRSNAKAAGAPAPAAGRAPSQGRRSSPPRPSPPEPPARPASTGSTAPGRTSSAPGGRSEDEVLAVVRAAGAAYRRVVFTRNRRVMASVAGNGAVLRLNEAFATAPDAVLAAVASLFTARDRRTRDRARDVVRRFIQHIPPHPAPPARRKRRVAPHDRAHLDRLRGEFERVNALHFGGTLPAVPLFLSGQMRRRNGHFSAHPLEIVISRRLCAQAEPGEAEHTLRHEIVHLWQHATGRPVDHGLEFRRMARKLDVHPRATRPVRWRT